MKIVCTILGLIFSNLAFAQIDTILLKQRVNQINTERKHLDFWEYIFERDQNMFQSNKLEEMNIENLVLVSYYLNKFGYPDMELPGSKAKIINMVWVHNKYAEIKKQTYPIILQGYLKEEISEFNLRDYFLRILYQEYFDDHGHMTKPLNQILKELEPNVTRYIDVNSFIQYYLEKENYFKQNKSVLGTWKSEDIIYSATLNEKPYTKEIPGNTVTIFKMPDRKYYFQPLVSGQSIEPDELLSIDSLNTTFRIARKQSQKTYQIAINGDLLFRDENEQTLLAYRRLVVTQD